MEFKETLLIIILSVIIGLPVTYVFGKLEDKYDLGPLHFIGLVLLWVLILLTITYFIL